MNRHRLTVVSVLLAALAAPATARINMMEPWSPGLDFRMPKETWNHDAHLRSGFGQHGRDFWELGYNLTTPLSPDWEVGGALNYESIHGGSRTESGFEDIPLGAKYRVPKERLPNALEVIGEAGLTLPTGDPDKGLGAGGLGLFGGGSVQAAMADNVTGYGHLGLRYYMKGQQTNLGEVVEYSVGVKYRVDAEWIATGDVRGFNHARDEYKGVKGKSYSEVYLAPGAVWRPSKVPADFLGTLLLGLTGDSYDFGFQVSAKF